MCLKEKTKKSRIRLYLVIRMSYIDYISLFYAFNTLHIYVCICLFLDLYNFIVST